MESLSRPPSSVSLLMSVMNIILYSGLAYVPVFIAEYSLLDSISTSLNRNPPEETFDFIIVGAGTSGSLVANRLSTNYRVLLLEAGGEPNPLMAIPAAASLFPNSPTLDWMFTTESQAHSCLSLNNNSSLWPRGKGLGGTSNLNFMAYIRGSTLDYDNWAQITGDQRWSYKNILPFFKKSEKYSANSDFDPQFHGTEGEMSIENTHYNLLAEPFVQASEELGFSRKDLNAPFDEGFSEFVFTAKRGRRFGSYQAFLEPLRNSRPNLIIRKYSEVSRVLFEGKDNRAYAVEYETFGQKYLAKATNEIILSAGTIGSPKILMHSGIGPEEHLRDVGIKPLVNLPVGNNLQDHVIGLVGPFTINQKLTFLLDRDSGPRGLIQYLLSGTGPLSSSGVQATGFIASSLEKKRAGQGKIWPDIQLILLGLPLHEEGPDLLGKLFNLRPEVAEEYYRPVVGQDSFHIMSIISRPQSKGTIRLRSNDPKDSPLIDPNYLSHPDDSKIILEGMEFALRMVENTTSFQSLGAKLSPKPFPSCKHLPFRSSGYWDCYLRHYTLSVYHPSGTCGMGRVGDPKAVLDSSLRVIGTKNLRVIDASIMPKIVSSNIQASCIAIAEMGSTFIMEEWENGRL